MIVILIAKRAVPVAAEHAGGDAESKDQQDQQRKQPARHEPPAANHPHPENLVLRAALNAAQAAGTFHRTDLSLTGHVDRCRAGPVTATAGCAAATVPGDPARAKKTEKAEQGAVWA